MENEKQILGCYVSCPATIYNDNEIQFLKQQELASEICKQFREYIWGENGLAIIFKKLMNEVYGNDLELALFQFYVKPIPYLQNALKEIESYRAKEKSIGIPIIINDENFFSKSEEERIIYLKQTILQKMDLLAEVVKKKKLDSNMELLKTDLEKVLNEF